MFGKENAYSVTHAHTQKEKRQIAFSRLDGLFLSQIQLSWNHYERHSNKKCYYAMLYVTYLVQYHFRKKKIKIQNESRPNSYEQNPGLLIPGLVFF